MSQPTLRESLIINPDNFTSLEVAMGVFCFLSALVLLNELVGALSGEEPVGVFKRTLRMTSVIFLLGLATALVFRFFPQ